MTTRLKTVEYWFPYLGSVPDNTATALSQITVYIPEAALSGVTFRSVTCDIVIGDLWTSSSTITSRSMTLTLQGASGSTVNNANTQTGSGENLVNFWSQDFTAYFNSNFGSNASRTLDGSITINTATTGCSNASIRLIITYAFDDADATHLKTVWIPLDADVNALATTKTACDTIPALDTYLPEASKVFRQITFVTQGNQESTSTTDLIRRIDIDSIGQIDATYEKGLNTSCWYRLSQVYSFDTSTTHTAYSWASATDFDHPQNYLVVTYEFSPGSTTSIMNSLLLPMEYGGCMGGPTSSDFQRATRTLWVQESTPVLTKLAVFIFWDQFTNMTGLNARIGGGSFIAYSSVGTALAGSCGLMMRNDSVFTLARGRNEFYADIYNTDSIDLGFNLSALWIVNYTSDVPTDGIWAANHTVIRNLKVVGTGAATNQDITSSVAPDIPETEFFVTSIGVQYLYITNTTNNAAGVHVGAQNDTATEWLNVYEAMGGTDAEAGLHSCYATARSVFNRFYNDAGEDRIAIQTARKWRLANSAASFDHLDMMLTYHTLTYVVSGTISGSNGGTVNLSLCRASSGEVLKISSRSGDGAYSFNWYDDTENVYVLAYEDSTYNGVSKQDTVNTNFDITLSGGASSGGEYFYASA